MELECSLGAPFGRCVFQRLHEAWGCPVHPVSSPTSPRRQEYCSRWWMCFDGATLFFVGLASDPALSRHPLLIDVVRGIMWEPATFSVCLMQAEKGTTCVGSHERLSAFPPFWPPIDSMLMSDWTTGSFLKLCFRLRPPCTVSGADPADVQPRPRLGWR